MGDARLIESQDCSLRMSKILGAHSVSTLPACTTSANTLLLKGLFSQHLQVSSTGKLEYLNLLAFQPRELESQQFPRIKTLSQLARCLTSMKVVFKAIEEVVAEEAPLTALANLTIGDSRSMMDRIFESIAYVLEYSDHANLDNLNINYIIEQVNTKVHNVFAEFRTASNLLLSKEEFMAIVIPLASITADSLIKGKDTFDSMNASDQMVMNLFTPSNGGGRGGRGGRGAGRGRDNIREGGRNDRGRGRGRGRGDDVPLAQSESMCFDHVNFKLGLRNEDCSRGISCLYAHVTPTSSNKKEVLAALQAIKGKKFKDKIAKAINDL